MAEPVRARRLTDAEGQALQRIVRRALVIMASASGTTVPAIAGLVQAHEDTVRDVIHTFNQRGLDALDPRWAGGRPRRISAEDEAFIVQAATTRPEKLGPSVHPLEHPQAGRLPGRQPGPHRDGRAGAATAAAAPQQDFLSAHPHVEGVMRSRAGGQAGPYRAGDQQRSGSLLRVRPVRAAVDPPLPRQLVGHPEAADRLPATYRRTHGIRYFHGCYSLGDDQLWGVTRRRKGAHHSLSALRSIRAVRPDGEQLYVILDNLSTNKTPAIRRWAKRNKVELCFTPTSASWANPIEAQFGPLRSFVLGDSNHPNHAVLARKLQGYLRWRNANARDPEVLAAQRRERARVRSERQRQWGRPARRAA
jgi:hypothetical protein